MSMDLRTGTELDDWRFELRREGRSVTLFLDCHMEGVARSVTVAAEDAEMAQSRQSSWKQSGAMKQPLQRPKGQEKSFRELLVTGFWAHHRGAASLSRTCAPNYPLLSAQVAYWYEVMYLVHE